MKNCQNLNNMGLGTPILKSLAICFTITLVVLIIFGAVKTPAIAGEDSASGSTPSINWGSANPYSLVPNASDACVQASSNRQPMYRLYNKWTGEHFYTSSSSERASNIKAGWKDEGIEWYAPSTSNTPVYRLYNPYTSDHHYTTKKTEYDSLGKSGWKQEGISWYSVDNGDSTRIPLYRQFNPFASTGTHNYTKDTAERDKLIGFGWKDEGIGWYGYASDKVVTQTLNFSKITVSTTAKTYNGKAQTQTVTSSAYKLNTDYTVTYSNNTNAGTATIVAKGKGNYTGTKTYTFKINKATPVCKAPTGLTGFVGDKLSSIDIASETVTGNTPGKFAWTDATQTLGDVAEYAFSARFTPTDTKNYESVEKVTVKVGTTRGYWLGTKNAGEEFVNEVYFARNDSNYVSGTDISADMAVLHDKSNSNYESVKAKWDKYYNDDKVRLYATYEGGENEKSFDSLSSHYNQGPTSKLNKYVEFRILEVSGADGHKLSDGTTSDGSAVTFMATHVLPTAYQMNKDMSNVDGWGACSLKDNMNSGEIYEKFSNDFVSNVKAITKEYNSGNMASQTAAPRTVDCKFWIPSYTELISATDSMYSSYLPKLEGTQYAWCAKNVVTGSGHNLSLMYETRGGATPGKCNFFACYWWERSPVVLSTMRYGFICAGGFPDYFMAADYFMGIVPAFAF